MNRAWRRKAAVAVSGACAVVVVSAGLGLTAGDASAQTPPQAIAYRKGGMQVQQWHLRTLVQMVKGARPFDSALYLRNVSILESQAAATAEGFVAGSDSGDTRALPTVWSDSAGFKSAIDRFQAESAKAVAIAKGGDEKAMRNQALEIARACDGCHEKFRSK
ncbi:MAG: cytochrome c [Proteobacteria bacterium]|nr:cytochrome c [Burkholderiales bacterium]